MYTFRRIFFGLWCLLFLLFAYWQLNDPDTEIWVSIYGVAVVLSAMAVVGRFSMPVLFTVIGLCLLGSIYYFPNSVSEWVQQEWQQQDLSMKTLDMEEARESFGLLIIAIVMSVAAFFGWQSKKRFKTVSGKPTRV